MNLHSTNFQRRFGHIRASELIFSQNVSELAFCLPKEKMELFLFFKNRKLTSTWLKSIQQYWRWKNKSQSMKKYFYAIFIKESCILSSWSKKMKENVLNIEYGLHAGAPEGASQKCFQKWFTKRLKKIFKYTGNSFFTYVV